MTERYQWSYQAQPAITCSKLIETLEQGVICLKFTIKTPAGKCRLGNESINFVLCKQKWFLY